MGELAVSRTRLEGVVALQRNQYATRACVSSTPSISSIGRRSLPGRTAANPTPQLPMTTVVTPCCDDGFKSESQVTCPS